MHSCMHAHFHPRNMFHSMIRSITARAHHPHQAPSADSSHAGRQLADQLVFWQATKARSQAGNANRRRSKASPLSSGTQIFMRVETGQWWILLWMYVVTRTTRSLASVCCVCVLRLASCVLRFSPVPPSERPPELLESCRLQVAHYCVVMRPLPGPCRAFLLLQSMRSVCLALGSSIASLIRSSRARRVSRSRRVVVLSICREVHEGRGGEGRYFRDRAAF